MFNVKTLRLNSISKRIKKPYLVAEAGVNHECSINTATKMIKLAKLGGADAIKFQYYKAETIASKKSPAYWDTKKEKSKNQFQLFKKYDHFNISDFKILKKECKKNKIDFMCTPFDVNGAKEINKLVDIFKISSSDITNYPLIKEISKFKKPIILSTGASNLDEIKEAIKLIKKFHNKIILLHCVLNYPTKNHNAFLGLINILKNKFKNIPIGYSDHTFENFNLNILTAWISGAVVIEKHFTHNKKLPGNDHYHSADFKDLINLNKDFTQVINSMQNDINKKLKIEKKSRLNARRSIYTTRNLKKNHRIQLKDIMCKRPAVGLHPKYFDKIIGKKIKKSKKEDTPIYMKDF
tara:strand:+ start:485 stop:1537 length:1053 start_codon:yes stop_codon:yes gene_type:complete